MKAHLIVSALALAATAVVSSAHALQINNHGADFQPYNAGQAQDIDYLASGVRTTASGSRSVIASIDHNPSSTGYRIDIDGTHSGAQTTSCTVYSYRYDGFQLAARSVSASSVSGTWTRIAYLNALESPQWSYFSVVCTIPGNGAGVLHGVGIL